jgi:hypothetical protein
MYSQDNVVNLIIRSREQQEKSREILHELIRNAINDGADSFKDLQDSELQLMTAAAIHAAAPGQVWQFISQAPGANQYPHLVAEALTRKYGGFLGLERTDIRLAQAILGGAICYAQGIIEQIFEEEKQRKECA